MWFKNIRPFRIHSAPDLTAESLGGLLEEYTLQPCARLQEFSTGWSSPYGREHTTLVHEVSKALLFRYSVSEKVLPAGVVKETLAERLSAFEQRAGRPPGAREKRQAKDEVLMDLLPRAFVQTKSIDACLDLSQGWLLVNSASAKQSENVAELLQRCVPALSITAPDMGNLLRTHMTHWLKEGQCPGDLDFSDEVDLQDEADERSTVRCRHQELRSSEISQHLKAGKRAQKVGLLWGDRLAFTLTDEFALLRIKMQDVVMQQLEEISTESDLDDLDAQFALMTLELRNLYGFLEEIFPEK